MTAPHRVGSEEQDPKPDDQKEPVNLRRMYPISYRSILKRSVHWIVGFLLLVIAITILDRVRPSPGTYAEQVFFFLGTTAFFVGVAVVIAKLLYELIYFHVYYYGTEIEHLVITSGILFKTRGSFPLARLADVYVERAPIDLLFMLYNLRITTPSPISAHGSIEGLSRRRANELQNYLLALVSTTTKASDEEKATEVLRTLKATEDPSILGASPAATDPPRAKPQLPLSSPAEADAALTELAQTQADLKHARQELAHADTALEKARKLIKEKIPPRGLRE